MPVDLDISEDWTTWDKVETVSYVVRRVGGDQILGNVTAMPSMASRAEVAPTGGAYTGYEQVWWVPAKHVPGVACKPADAIEDTRGFRLVVIRAEHRGHFNYWRLVTRNVALANDLVDRVTILRPVNAVDAAGGRVPTWTTLASNVAARLQERKGAEADERGRRLVRREYEITLDRQLVVGIEDRVQDASGALYAIKGYRDGNLLDRLPVLDAVRVA